MKKILPILIFAFCFTGILLSQNMNGRISSAIYTFERFDSANASNTYARAYQTLSLNFNKDFFALRTSMNLENDFSKNLTDDPKLRFYNLYIEARNLFDVATLRFGRQPIFNSVAGGVFDGGSIDLKYSMFRLNGYYGGNVPAYQKFEITNDFENDFIVGGKLSATPIDEMLVSFSYINKNFKPQEYHAIRKDEDLNPIDVLVRSRSNQFKFLSGEVSYYMKDLFMVDTRYDYDLNFEQTSKFEISADYQQVKNLNVNVYYNYREPRISYNSIFSVFNYGNSQEIEVGADYTFINDLTLTGKVANVKFQDENSQRISIGFSTKYGNIFYRKNLGWAGELDNIGLYTAHTFMEGLLTPSIGLSYSGYKLSKEDEKNDLLSLLAGVNVRPFRTLSFDVQGQYLNNRIYKNDLRFFFKINYWFNTNLNLM